MQHTTDFRIIGGNKLTGTIRTNTSKNGSVALLCAALINQNTTRLRGIARIEEVCRLIEVMQTIGVSVEEKDDEIIITPPKRYNLEGLDTESFSRIRSSLMLIPAIAQKHETFTLPVSGGCKMGKRTTIAHKHGLEKLGISITPNGSGSKVTRKQAIHTEVILYEMSDTATINVLLTAAYLPQETVISFASANYQVQEICFFLQDMGIEIEGVGTTSLRVHGLPSPTADITYTNSEDPIESMTFIAIAAGTKSEIKITRAPIDFLTLELITLESMGFLYTLSDPYLAENGRTKLVDITTKQSILTAPEEKIHARPYPGINSDNLPFFIPIAIQATGTTMIHDWMWENRAAYFTKLNRFGAQVLLLDPHRAVIHGGKSLKGAKITCPPALRPAMVMLTIALAAEGESLLRNTYVISRGYANIAERLRSLGADISVETQE